jgi:hypothetical protein
MAVEKLLNLRLALIVLAAILGAFGLTNAFVAVFFQAKQEVTYRFDVTVTYCAEGHCAYSAVLEVANTGRETQPEVSVRLKGLPPGIGGNPKVLNLSAADPRESDPVIEQERLGEVHIVRLRGFAPGTLAQFVFRGSIAAGQLAAASDPAIEISGRGKMVRGDPRAIAFARWFG